MTEKGKSIYFSAAEIQHINLTMSNQDSFSDDAEQELSQSIYEKTLPHIPKVKRLQNE